MSNPVLSENRWEAIAASERPTTANAMTVGGTMFKTGVLFLFLLASTGWMWSSFWHGKTPDVSGAMPWLIGGAIGGLVLCLIAMFIPKMTMIIAPLYALAQGLVIGGLTMFIETQFPGKNLPILAACLTSACFLAMLLLYQLRIIQATPALVRGVMIATVGLVIGIGLLTLLTWFGIGGGIMENLRGSGPIGIGFSVLCIGLAAFNLVVDFGFIENGSRQGLPKYMEWVGAFGLVVTLVWLYIEILQLLAKLQRRD